MDTIVNQENRELALAFLAQIKDKKEILESGKGVKVKLQDSEEYLTIPREVFALMIDAIVKLAKGNRSVKKEVTLNIKEAAEILLLEEEDILEMIDKGILSAKKSKGSYGFSKKDVFLYSKKRDKKRRALLNEIAKDSQEMGLY